MMAKKDQVAKHKQVEKTLEAELNFLWRVIDTSPNFIFVRDRDGKFLMANEAMAQAYGTTVEDITGKTDADFNPNPEEVERFLSDDREVMNSLKQKALLERSITDADGAVRWLEIIKFPLVDEDGVSRRVLGIANDITDQVLVKIDLQQLSRAVEATHDAIVITDLNGNIQFVNPAFSKITGYSLAEALGRNTNILKSGRQSSNTYKEMWKAITSGQVWQGDVTNKRKDNSLYEAQLTISPIRNTAGKIEQFVAIQRDITERKRAEEELQRLRSAVEQAGDGIAVANLEGNILFANLAWAEMHGYSVEEIQGQHLSMFHTKEQIQQEVEQFNAVVMQTGTNSGRVGHAHKNGTTFPTQMTTTLLLDASGTPTGLVGTARDITEQVRLEQQIRETLERRNRQVQLTTEISQEITGTPSLAEIYNYVVTSVKEGFGYYHVQIFRHNPEKNTMVVIEGYGAAGKKMIAAKHNLPFGKGVVGTAAATGEPVLASNVGDDPNWVPHPDLPDTKGELAIPIKWQNEVIGILDVQHDEANALTEEDQVVLLGLAGQIASAVESARLFEESQNRVRREQTLREITSRLRNFTDPDAVIRAAVRDLSKNLDRPTFIRLGSAEELSSQPEE
ncbi:MAG: hypothetical protein B6I38_08515 [Anaerolineaceae bacterium 4572_5.1]|nr:MAG: hypothetical protein B6I38_08515 [Anaerolineaceae bacterium 4572_5.1]